MPPPDDMMLITLLFLQSPTLEIGGRFMEDFAFARCRAEGVEQEVQQLEEALRIAQKHARQQERNRDHGSRSEMQTHPSALLAASLQRGILATLPGRD